MKEIQEASTDSLEDLIETLPPQLCVSVQGFHDEEFARELGTYVMAYARGLSRHMDLSGLDGITVAGDYMEALLRLDRGFDTVTQLTPTDGAVVGVAMAPCVLRNGIIKTHIVLDAGVVAALRDNTDEAFPTALHILAHECAHAENSLKFDLAFPNLLLGKKFDNSREAFRYQVTSSCWDEYAATALSAQYGEDQTENYENTFINALKHARPSANAFIKAYRIHGDVNQVYGEVYGTYGNLLKFAAYHLGNLHGHDISPWDRKMTAEALQDHWFKPFFERLDKACKYLASQYGEWNDFGPFDAIGDISDDLVALGGVIPRLELDGRLYLDIPYTEDTMPV